MFCRCPPGSPGPISAGCRAFSVVYTTNTCLPHGFFTVQAALFPRGELTPGSLIDQPHWTRKAGSSLNTRPKASSAALSFSSVLHGAALYPSQADAPQMGVDTRWTPTGTTLLMSFTLTIYFENFVNACNVFWSSAPPFSPPSISWPPSFGGGGFILIYSLRVQGKRMKPWQQKLEVADHMASVLKKQRWV